MQLNKLLNDIKIKDCSVDLSTDIKNIISNHNNVKEGSAFVAVRGNKNDGNRYIKTAFKSGAAVVVTENAALIKGDIPCVLVENSREALAKMWSNYYSNPAKDMKIVAITGTNGKTSTAYFLYNILRKAKVSCGLISTVESLVNDEKISVDKNVPYENTNMTTPDPEILYYTLNIMKENGAKFVIMEASSHALTQGRLAGIDIEIGAFTNLSCEHLDYHKSMEEYFNAKLKLVDKSKYFLTNSDDAYGEKIKIIYPRVLGVSAVKKDNFRAENVICDSEGCRYKFSTNDESFDVSTKVIGSFTVYNTLLAASCASLLGIERKYIQQGLAEIKGIKGRMEQYSNKQIYIDYAHTPEAMRNVILSFRKIFSGKRITVVFGCGGDRDKSKRALMGEISTVFADKAIITADNSRGESLSEILAEIASGAKGQYTVIPDRAEAIKFAVKNKAEDEVILLLGKGHEDYEINTNGKIHFSEREILDEIFCNDR